VAILRVHDCPSEHLATLVDGRPAPTAARSAQGSHKPHHNSRERALRGERSSGNRDESHRRAISQIAGLDDALPYVALLPDGTRVHAMLSTISGPGHVPSFARATEADTLAPKAGCLRHDLDDARHCYAGWSKPMLAALHALVLRSERVLIVEDSRELALDPPHAIRLEGRPPNW
jgi:hypothetical protein